MGMKNRAIIKKGPVELVGIDEQIDQNDLGGAVSVALSSEGHSGEILNVTLVSTEDGSGAVQVPDCTLFVFNADPDIDPGDVAMAAASRLLEVGQVTFATGDWKSDANGASQTKAVALSFERVTALWFALLNASATGLNDAAGDDEQIELIFRYRRDN